jgi:glucosamine--fructose-6-phosphate aminotransferase (isomerizing)
MCGIVGYVGNKTAEPILIGGLRHLEYRGYDSAGLAFLDKGAFSVVRAEGKLDKLVAKLRETPHPATVGIGHTRWATHGKPNETNAHPHQSDDVVLVHNGIIENYLAIKKDLVAKGFRFASETDTEVVAHRIQEHLNGGADFLTAFRRLLAEVKGAFSFVVLHKKTPDKIFVAKQGSPLVAGVADGESFVASDIPALLGHTREMYFLEDGEMAVLSRSGIEFYDFVGNPLVKDSKHIPWTAAQAEKGGYKHFMLKEIMEQPRALADTMLGRIDGDLKGVSLGNADALIENVAANAHARIHVIACGTSWHAGLLARTWIEELARVPVHVDLSSEFRYRKPLLDKDSLVIAISQSGETADTLAAVKEARKLGAKVLSVCNVLESSIPRSSDATLYTHAGPEIGVASTKAFITQMAALYLVALKLAILRKTLTAVELASRLQATLELPALTERFLKDVSGIETLTEKIRRKQHCYFLARGTQYPIVLEGALKMKELSYVHAEGYAGGEMKHGPIALIEEGIPVLAVALRDGLYEKMVSGIEEVAARGAQISVLVSAGDTELKSKFADTLEVPSTHPDLMPFLTVIPFQLLAYHVADKKGTDVDQPRNLAKSVTVE